MAPYKSHIDLPDEYFRLIGIISAQWEYVEVALERAVAEIGGHKYSRVGLLTANLGFQTKADLIMAYGRALQTSKPAEWAALKKVLKGLKDAYTLRNTYVHAKWFMPKKKGSLPTRSVVRTKGGNLNIADVPTTTEQMAIAAENIHTAGDEFVKLMNSFALLLPKKKKPRGKRV